MDNSIRKIGLDPGFGGLKVAEIQDGQIVTHHLPSVVGVGSTDAGALNLAGVVRSRRVGDQPHRVAFNGAEYLVGSNVHLYARPIERMDFDRFTEGPELRALFYAALYRLLDGGGHRLALAVGLPVEVLQDAAQAAATERAMSAWLLGCHSFSIDGVAAELEVIALRAKIAQPVACWFSWGLTNDGQWDRAKDGRSPCLVIDEGFNTLDLLVVEGGRISTRYTTGDTLGMRRAAEMTARNVDQYHGVELSLHEADALVQRVVQGKKASTFVLGQSTDVTALVQQAVDALAADVLRFVERSVSDGRKFQILLTGGGALALAPRLRRQYRHAVVVDDPVLANARGLAKLAQRPGFLV